MKSGFPYEALLKHPAWEPVRAALEELENNDDLEFRTAEKYVIGHLISRLIDAGLLPPNLDLTPEQRANSAFSWVLNLKVAEVPWRSNGKQKNRPAAATKGK